MYRLEKYGRGLFSAAFFILFFYGSSAQNETDGTRVKKRVTGKPSADWFENLPNLVPQKEWYPVYMAPVLLWNNYNKTMLGVSVRNRLLPHKEFEYSLVPMVSLNPAGFAFLGGISYTRPIRKKRLESILYKIDYTRLAYDFDSEARDWNRIAGYTEFRFGHEPRHIHRSMAVYVRSIFNILEATDVYRSAFGKNTLSYNINEAGFMLSDSREKHPYRLLFAVEYIQELGNFSKPGIAPGNTGKASVTFHQRISYFSPKKGLDIRFFAGTFLGNGKTLLDYRYRMSAYPGYWDYKFDHYYFGRAETLGVLSRQFHEYDGGFKVFTPLGQTNRWLMALNLKASLPGPIPVKPFFDMALHRQVVTVANTGSQIKSVEFNYSGGVMLSVINDVLEIYFPVFHSADIRDYLSLNNVKWHQQIRFRLNLLQLNPHQIRNKIEWLPR